MQVREPIFYEVANHGWLKEHRKLVASIERPPEPSEEDQGEERRLGVWWESLPPPPKPNAEIEVDFPFPYA